MLFESQEMDIVTDRDALRQRYADQYGVTAGHLPSNLDGLDEWLAAVIERVESGEEPVEQPSVAALRSLIAGDREVRGLLEMAIAEADGTIRSPTGSNKPDVHAIASIDQLLKMLNHILTEAPTPQNAFPVSGVFLYMMFTKAGWHAFRNPALNDALAAVLDQYEAFLNSPESWQDPNVRTTGWLGPASQRKMDLKDFEVDWSKPDGGFGCYNDFFHRQIKPGVRQLAGEHDPDKNTIVSANDGVVFKISRLVQMDAKFWTKDQPYSLRHVLNGEKRAPKFVNGDVFQTYLSGQSFHRWVAPIGGTVVEAEVVPGLMFSELRSVGWDPGGGTMSTAYEASVNTRGIVIIDSGDATIGLVAVIPIGITEVSSVKHMYADDTPLKIGDTVEQGQEIGRFSLGGSTLALVFQPGAIDSFRWPSPPLNGPNPPPVHARDWIALANRPST